jgi:predicted transcriptional regulator
MTETRGRIADRVRADPGVHLSAVSDRVELPLSTARYHLRILEHEGLVRGVKLRGKRRYFPPDVEAEALVASLADEATATVLRSLVDAGPAT